MDLPANVQQPEPDDPDGSSARHDLQYFELFSNSGAAKTSRFGGSINWVRFELTQSRRLPASSV